ncbi:MAG: DHHA1 domain-containing protein, partial [Acidimicrobiales bacterium]
GPDYLRFDFSNPGPVDAGKLAQVEQLVNEQILANDPVRTYETSKTNAEKLGAIAFFGDKYGEYVRVVEAGTRSMELCGGTHVGALGMIGPVKVLSESSIGSNLRRITAVTGAGTLQRIREDERLLASAAELLRSEPGEVPTALERVLEHQKALESELKALRGQAAAGEATSLAAGAVAGIVVARRDGLSPDQLRELTLTVRASAGIRAVALAGTPDGAKVALVVAVAPGSGLDAPALVGEAARLVGGGGGGKGDVAMAGGRDASGIDAALDAIRARLSS